MMALVSSRSWSTGWSAKRASMAASKAAWLCRERQCPSRRTMNGGKTEGGLMIFLGHGIIAVLRIWVAGGHVSSSADGG